LKVFITTGGSAHQSGARTTMTRTAILKEGKWEV